MTNGGNERGIGNLPPVSGYRFCFFDLDGTLIRTDSYLPVLLAWLRKHPGRCFKVGLLPFTTLAWLAFRRRERQYIKEAYLTAFMGGARRQIFVVFAGFLIVEKFGFSAADISIMFLANGLLNMFFAPRIGRLIGYWGERKALTLEYIGLILVFVAYAFVANPWVAVGLYIVDHLLFSMAIAQKTYFQKIADPRDMAPTAGVAFSINHIAAVLLPAVYGVLWLWSPSAVFLTGALLAGCSLALARLVPAEPLPGRETEWRRSGYIAGAERCPDRG